MKYLYFNHMPWPLPFDHQSSDNDILAINKEILLALTLAYFLFPNARSSIFASKILDLFLLR